MSAFGTDFVSGGFHACGTEQCPASFRTFSAFRSHMHRNHHYCRPQTKQTHFLGNLACRVEACSYVAENFSTLCTHLRFHIKDGKKVVCPYADCNRHFRVQSSFATNISRKHKHKVTAQLSAQSDNVGCMQTHEENLTPTPCDDKKGRMR